VPPPPAHACGRPCLSWWSGSNASNARCEVVSRCIDVAWDIDEINVLIKILKNAKT